MYRGLLLLLVHERDWDRLGSHLPLEDALSALLVKFRISWVQSKIDLVWSDRNTIKLASVKIRLKVRSGFSCQTELIFKSEVVVGWDRRHSLNRSLLLDVHGLLRCGGHLDNLWSRLLLYDDLRLCLSQRYLAQRRHKLLTHGMQVLLPDHLILLEFKFSLRYEKLVILIL